MLPSPSPSIYQTPKCFITYGTLGHVDPDQSPNSQKPWSSLRKMSFLRNVDLVLPSDKAVSLQRRLAAQRKPSYSRVKMTVGQVLERDFFNCYVKEGHVQMLSQGKTAVDDMFTLESGILTLYMCKESYERAGLVGKTYGAKGARKLRPRWVVTYDLKSSTMAHGKKGFDRLIYACQTVFNKPIVWLFTMVSGDAPSPDPLQKYSPITEVCSPELLKTIQTASLDLQLDQSLVASGDRSAMEMAATNLYEWLSMARLQSPRVSSDDNIDAFLSRYEQLGNADSQMDICVVRWQGFLSPKWLQQLALDVIGSLDQQTWFALAATEVSRSLSGAARETVLLRPERPKGEYIMWEIQGSE